MAARQLIKAVVVVWSLLRYVVRQSWGDSGTFPSVAIIFFCIPQLYWSVVVRVDMDCSGFGKIYFHSLASLSANQLRRTINKVKNSCVCIRKIQQFPTLSLWEQRFYLRYNYTF